MPANVKRCPALIVQSNCMIYFPFAGPWASPHPSRGSSSATDRHRHAHAVSLVPLDRNTASPASTTAATINTSVTVTMCVPPLAECLENRHEPLPLGRDLRRGRLTIQSAP